MSEGIGALGPHFAKMFGLCSVSNGKLSKGLKLNAVIIRFVFSRKIALAAVQRERGHSTKDTGRPGRRESTQQQRPRFQLLSDIVPDPIIPQRYEIYPNKPSLHLLISSQVVPRGDRLQPSFLVLEERCRAKHINLNGLFTQKTLCSCSVRGSLPESRDVEIGDVVPAAECGGGHLQVDSQNTVCTEGGLITWRQPA